MTGAQHPDRGANPARQLVVTQLGASQLGATQLGGLVLARSGVDRMGDRRGDDEWLAAAWADPRTRVLVLHGDRALVRFGDGAAELILVPPGEAPDGQTGQALRCLLGVDDAGVAYFGVLAPPAGRPAAERPFGERPHGARPVVRLAALREVAALLSDRDAGLFTHAVALGNWHATHTHCPRCGTPTGPILSGHARRCPKDGSDHFPRVDPAVIMLVTDPADRCLLARNRQWPERRVSVLAGFVEPGESLELAVIREVSEETGITVSSVRYMGSQPWPMPQSLMLGFRAVADGDLAVHVDDEEIAEAYWFSRDELRAAMAADQIRLPPPVSIAHQLIESWYGGELPGTW